MLRYLSLIAILTTTSHYTTHLALVERPIPFLILFTHFSFLGVLIIKIIVPLNYLYNCFKAFPHSCCASCLSKSSMNCSSTVLTQIKMSAVPYHPCIKDMEAVSRHPPALAQEILALGEHKLFSLNFVIRNINFYSTPIQNLCHPCDFWE